MLRISARLCKSATCKRHGKNCTESGNLCRVNPAYRKKLPFRKGVAFAELMAWHGRCCAISLRKCLKLHLAIALATLGMANAMYFAKRGNPSNTKPNQTNDHRNQRTVRNIQNPSASRRSPFGVCGNASFKRKIGCQANQATVRI